MLLLRGFVQTANWLADDLMLWQRLNNHTIDSLMRGLGCFLLTLGIFCAKSSVDYFLSPPPDAK